MRYMTKCFLSVLFLVFVGVCFCGNVSAANSLIKTTWVKGNSGIDSDGGTTFSIGMKFKGDCLDTTCQLVNPFRCTSRGKAYTTCIDDSKTTITKDDNKSNAEWKYYKVNLYPCSSSQQTISGYIRKKNRYTLTVREKNIYNNNDLGSYEATTGYGWKTASRYAKDGYKFVGWNHSDNQSVMTSSERLSKSSTDISKGCVKDDNNFCNYKGSKANTTSGGHDVYTKVLVNLNQKRTVYAYFAKIYKLTIKIGSGTSVTVNRTSTDYGPNTRKIQNGGNIYEGDVLHICVQTKSNYENPVLKIKSGSGSYGAKSLNSGGCYDYRVENDTYIQTSASPKGGDKGFVGLSRVANAMINSDNEDTGWVQSDAEVRNYIIEDCNPMVGCAVVIAHHLKRMSGSGEPSSVSFDNSERSLSVYSGESVGNGVPCYKSNAFCKDGDDNGEPGDLASEANKRDVTVRRMMYILKPGQKVCETMRFNPFPGKNDVASLTVCAYAVGSASTNLRMEIQNDSVPKYGFYTAGPVYAKPGDRVYYRAIYNPRAQYAFPLVPEGARINDSDIHFNPDGSVVRHLGADFAGVLSMFNRYKQDGLQNWHNGFSMQISDDSFETTKMFHNRDRFGGGEYDAPYRDYVYSSSEDSRADEKIEDYVYNGTNNPVGGGVAEGDVGKVIIGRSLTNLEGSRAETTPSKVTFKMEDGYNIGNVETASVKSNDVRAIIPYNFNLKTSISNEKTVVYAGESSSVGYDIEIEDRYNGLLDDTYSTIVRGGVQRIRVCTDPGMTNGCSEVYDKFDNETWSKNEELKDNTTIQIPDVPAGTKLYVRSEVYPKSSAGKNNNKDDSLDPAGECDFEDVGCWAVSETKELIVAKRPSLQVWGGNVYSAGAIDLTQNVSKKTVLDGYTNLEDEESFEGESQDQSDTYHNAVDVSYVFGSWTELGLISGGSVKGLASGAGLGYAATSDARLAEKGGGIGVSSLGGSDSMDFCKISTLSFANNNCRTSVGDISVGNVNVNKADLAADFNDSNNDDYVLIDRGSEDVQISSAIVGKIEDYDGNEGGVIRKTKVIKTSGKVSINKNVTYKEDGYQKLEDIPKIIIYAGNIEIVCGVNRVDAVLISEGDINTCSDSNNDNAQSNSNPLKINGATISDTLNLKRTYGAATGVNSIVPAEIVNYDTSLYLWANKQADVTSSGKLTEASVRELAPRY